MTLFYMLKIASIVLLLVEAQVAFEFELEGIGKLHIDKIPPNLPNLVAESENFCRHNAEAIKATILPHRCEWLVGGALLEAIFVQTKANENYYLKLPRQTNPVSQRPCVVRLKKGRTVLFLMHDAVPLKLHALNGGTQSVIEVAAALHKYTELEVKIAILNAAMPVFKDCYPEAFSLRLFLGYDDFSVFTKQNKGRYGAIVATYFVTLWMLKQLAVPGNKLVYFVQDYEPWFTLRREQQRAAQLSYITMHKHVEIVSYSSWIRNQLFEKHGVGSFHVDTHADTILTPLHADEARVCNAQSTVCLSKQGSRRSFFHVGIMVRPHTPRRGWEKSIEFLNQITTDIRSGVKYHIFGCTLEVYKILVVPKLARVRNIPSAFIHHGVLNRTGMKRVLQQLHTFVDISLWQAFGFTAFEGMAYGVVPIIPVASGLASYGVFDGKSGIVIEPGGGTGAYVNAVTTLLQNASILKEMSNAAVEQFNAFGPRRTAASWRNILFCGIPPSH